MKYQVILSALALMGCGGVDMPPCGGEDAATEADAATDAAPDAADDVCYPAKQACPMPDASDGGCGWSCASCTAVGFTCPNGDTSAVVLLNTCTGAVGTCQLEQAMCGSTCALDGGASSP